MVAPDHPTARFPGFAGILAAADQRIAADTPSTEQFDSHRYGDWALGHGCFDARYQNELASLDRHLGDAAATGTAAALRHAALVTAAVAIGIVVLILIKAAL